MSPEHRLPGLSDLVLERDDPAHMRDGTTLYADVYRPTSQGPFPVILVRLPYDKAQAADVTYRHPSWYARQGYMVVVQDARGRWRSEGDFYPFIHEAEDGYDTVEWAASLPHSSGYVMGTTSSGTPTNDYYYYRCRSRHNVKSGCANGRGVRADELEREAWEVVYSVLLRPDLLRAGLERMIESKMKVLATNPEEQVAY